MRKLIAVITLALVAGCGAGSYAAGPGGGGGPVGSVTVGPSVEFVSRHNGTRNPAVDTIPVGGTVTWTWDSNSAAYGGHSVRAGGASFVSSAVWSSGSYTVTFDTAGTYHYDCAVHGAAMAGTIVVR